VTLAAAPVEAVAILMYHSIATSSTASFRHLTVDPMLFDEQLDALRGAGVRLLPVDAVPRVLAGAIPPDGSVFAAVTIDDGLADVITGAAGPLARHAVPATVFIPTVYVGGAATFLSGDDAHRPLVGWQEIADLADAGLEIGSHGHRHLASDVNSSARVREDAVRSRLELEDRLGRAIHSFAYPFGYAPPAARRAIRQAGFGQACAVADLPAQAGDDRFALPRLHVRPETTPERLLSLVRHRPPSAARWWAHVKQQMWTEGRRWAGARRRGAS
jgi:peptidoglycan/xylan/chitin deacetylase (PgdA/CDA1 family)